MRPRLQRPQDQRLPFAADDRQRGVHIAFFNAHVFRSLSLKILAGTGHFLCPDCALPH
jgi:hypothetical protein